tara:strand:- start:99 stop:1283 length:1185 start_codon:yes stop_codon:yes gene_type:complete
MEENKNEEVVQEITEQVEDTKQTEDTTQVDQSKFDSADDDSVAKIDLNQPLKTKENEQPIDGTETEEVQEEVVKETTNKEEVVEQSTKENTEQSVVEEITEETTKEQVEDVINEAIETGKPLPESIEKLVNFMEQTGGDLEDYVALSRNYDDYDDSEILMEYYTHSKPHLTQEEIAFTLEDQFSWDEDMDEELDIRRKQLALKEQVANARHQMDELKSMYYEEIKSGSRLTGEQQKAINFFNRYNEESKTEKAAMENNQKVFIDKTEQVFNDKFKGFEYNVGDKKFRFNVNDVDKVKNEQADLTNFVQKFLNDKHELSDAKGYHKSLFSAMNPDAIANHFYEQGKSDAMKNSVTNAKNINMTPRQSHGEIETGGLKFKVLGDTAEDFKFKIKQK